ncbi:hypothetical protein ABNB59_00815 [Paenibacillus larvae]|uniref:Amidohydrolase-like protein n=2 Tax=Paenibacillus larvae TaxID=1464 RepID=V9W6P4_9BACL|nr:amidohydrolase-like protein [Paenibacillus larvae]AHD05634.1 amidohydrolase-like protein [Paenibacillus larvae subsp. larvae DSM 25430]ETK26973.1 hypothetical protein ERIC1_1c04100 [Paenibacillus larvae subsp. larvae DSM 25719]PCK70600.1 amidohydrolase-like protein [Paenibacillus larvae subsp. larvae B-3650]AQR76898.1 hypothetical protein BXP28_05500 [Paenibacillus larvae subsp. larvae]MCY7491224.1 hypothetical protein [Paenibacillus larvae]
MLSGVRTFRAVCHPPNHHSEDFSAYTDKLAGVFVGLGAKDETADALYMNHHPKFTVDEEAFQTGVKLFVMIAARKLLGLKG